MVTLLRNSLPEGWDGVDVFLTPRGDGVYRRGAFLAVFIVFFPLIGIVVVELPAFHGTVLLINRLDVCQPLIKRVGGACPRTALLTLG